MSDTKKLKRSTESTKVSVNGVRVDNTVQPKSDPDKTTVTVSGEIDLNYSSLHDVKVIKTYGKMSLERKMNKLISQGYTPQGGPTVIGGTNPIFGNHMPEYTQVMIKN